MKALELGILCVACLLIASLAACSVDEAGGSASLGDARRGQSLFEQLTIGPSVAPGCVTCHSVDAMKILVGPPLAGLSTKAADREPGKSAEEYLRESIITPDTYLVDGFVAGIMYQNYGKDLSEQEINDLVAYLLSIP